MQTYCENCKKQVIANKPIFNPECKHGVHFILTLCTGVWGLVWLCCAFNNGKHYCYQCGKEVMLGVKGPKCTCKKCGAYLDENVAFCPNCGKSTGLICKKCKTRNEIGAKFCKSCGIKLSTK